MRYQPHLRCTFCVLGLTLFLCVTSRDLRQSTVQSSGPARSLVELPYVPPTNCSWNSGFCFLPPSSASELVATTPGGDWPPVRYLQWSLTCANYTSAGPCQSYSQCYWDPQYVEGDYGCFVRPEVLRQFQAQCLQQEHMRLLVVLEECKGISAQCQCNDPAECLTAFLNHPGRCPSFLGCMLEKLLSAQLDLVDAVAVAMYKVIPTLQLVKDIRVRGSHIVASFGRRRLYSEAVGGLSRSPPRSPATHGRALAQIFNVSLEVQPRSTTTGWQLTSEVHVRLPLGPKVQLVTENPGGSPSPPPGVPHPSPTPTRPSNTSTPPTSQLVAASPSPNSPPLASLTVDPDQASPVPPNPLAGGVIPAAGERSSQSSGASSTPPSGPSSPSPQQVVAAARESSGVDQRGDRKQDLPAVWWCIKNITLGRTDISRIVDSRRTHDYSKSTFFDAIVDQVAKEDLLTYSVGVIGCLASHGPSKSTQWVEEVYKTTLGSLVEALALMSDLMYRYETAPSMNQVPLTADLLGRVVQLLHSQRTALRSHLLHRPTYQVNLVRFLTTLVTDMTWFARECQFLLELMPQTGTPIFKVYYEYVMETSLGFSSWLYFQNYPALKDGPQPRVHMYERPTAHPGALVLEASRGIGGLYFRAVGANTSDPLWWGVMNMTEEYVDEMAMAAANLKHAFAGPTPMEVLLRAMAVSHLRRQEPPHDEVHWEPPSEVMPFEKMAWRQVVSGQRWLMLSVAEVVTQRMKGGDDLDDKFWYLLRDLMNGVKDIVVGSANLLIATQDATTSRAAQLLERVFNLTWRTTDCKLSEWRGDSCKSQQEASEEALGSFWWQKPEDEVFQLIKKSLVVNLNCNTRDHLNCTKDTKCALRALPDFGMPEPDRQPSVICELKDSYIRLSNNLTDTRDRLATSDSCRRFLHLKPCEEYDEEDACMAATACQWSAKDVTGARDRFDYRKSHNMSRTPAGPAAAGCIPHYGKFLDYTNLPQQDSLAFSQLHCSKLPSKLDCVQPNRPVNDSSMQGGLNTKHIPAVVKFFSDRAVLMTVTVGGGLLLLTVVVLGIWWRRWRRRQEASTTPQDSPQLNRRCGKKSKNKKRRKRRRPRPLQVGDLAPATGGEPPNPLEDSFTTLSRRHQGFPPPLPVLSTVDHVAVPIGRLIEFGDTPTAEPELPAPPSPRPELFHIWEGPLGTSSTVAQPEHQSFTTADAGSCHDSAHTILSRTSAGTPSQDTLSRPSLGSWSASSEPILHPEHAHGSRRGQVTNPLWKFLQQRGKQR